LVEHSMCTNTINDFVDVENWVSKTKKNFNTKIDEISLAEMSEWIVNDKKISHASGKFFEIIGLRIGSDSGREINWSWDQPIVKEHNFDGGVLCLMRSYINELPHYLVQARFEPGNYGPIQISPTLQATFSNLNQEHGGSKPNYHEFFSDFKNNNKDYKFNQWLSEDGGKFYLKRNRGLVKQVEYKDTYLLDDTFMWVSMYQIKQLLNVNSLINPHLARLIFL